MAFHFLASNAAAAASEHERLAADSNFPGRAFRAIKALSEIGPAGAPALARLGVSQNCNTSQYYDAMLLSLQNSARYSNAVVRHKALDALTTTRDSQTEFVLNTLLQDPNPAVRLDATNALLRSALLHGNDSIGKSRRRSQTDSILIPPPATAEPPFKPLLARRVNH